jgi:putative endonuclease
MEKALSRASLGRRGEDRAAAALEAKGMRVIARNFRCPAGEVDLIALDGGVLVFVEVKTWTTRGIDALEHAVGIKKQRRIIETANYFLSSHREYKCMAIRFDVVFIGPSGLTHLAAAFTECV